MAGGGGEEKTEKATPKKRRDERKEGNIFFSKDVVSVVFIFGAFYSLKLLMPGITESTSSFMVNMVTTAGTADPASGSMGSLQRLAQDFASTAAGSLIPIMLICMLLGILGTGVQTKFLFSKKSMQPKFSRLSPLKGIKKMFSLKNLVELLKSMLKIIVMAAIMYTILRADFISIARTMDMDVRASTAYVLGLILDMVLKLCLVFLVIAIFDWMYQRWEYERNIKMSKHDIKEEYKQTEGNPQIKGKIKEIQRQKARSRMMQSVPDADVVIKNPTHFAVALRYDMDNDNAPVLLAKGQDELALRIIQVGEEHQIPVIENKPLARGIFATTELGREIPAEYYGAVAEVLVYVYKLNNKEGFAPGSGPAGPTGTGMLGEQSGLNGQNRLN